MASYMRLEVRLLIRQQLGQSSLAALLFGLGQDHLAHRRRYGRPRRTYARYGTGRCPRRRTSRRLPASCGVSALVRTPSLRSCVSPAHERSRNRRRRTRQRSGSPRHKSCRWSRRCEIQSPSWKVYAADGRRSWLLRPCASRRSRRRSRCPCRGQQPPRGRSCRRGRSGCPEQRAMPSMSSGEVSRRTRTTFSPRLGSRGRLPQR